MTPQQIESSLGRSPSKEDSRWRHSIILCNQEGFTYKVVALEAGGEEVPVAPVRGCVGSGGRGWGVMVQVRVASVSLLASLSSAWMTSYILLANPSLLELTWLGKQAEKRGLFLCQSRPGSQPAEPVTPPGCLHTAEEPSAVSSVHQPVG